MAKLNTTPTKSARKDGFVTHEGATAKRIDAVARLRRSVLSCLLWEDEFYEDGESIAARIAAGVAAVPLEVSAALAIEAREIMHLRHVGLLVVREMARQGGPLVGDTLARVIQRPDELTEFLAIYWKGGRQPLTNQIRKGLARAFPKFDAYALAKYDRAEAIKLRDVLFLCHAKPKDDEQAATWKALVEKTLAAPDTWEVALSSGEEGKTVEDKRERWTRLLTERKLGGLALLRNLRNFEAAGVPETLVREAIAENKFRRVLPFRFIAAARYAPGLEDALEGAMFRAAESLPVMPGKTVLLVDHSGSMQATVSARSEISRFDAAAALGMLLRETAGAIAVYTFSEDVRKVPPRRGFALRDAIKERVNPTSTYLGRAVRYINDHGDGDYDRLIVITDEQSHDVPPDPTGKGYVVNVGSYANGIGYGAWTHIDGWSEGILRYITAIEGLDDEPETRIEDEEAEAV